MKGDLFDPVLFALYNPLIVDQILSNLTSPQLFQTRLVNNLWNSVAISSSPPPFVLNIDKLETQIQPETISKKLTKKIRISRKASKERILLFYSLFGCEVQDLEINLELPEIADFLSVALNQNNLQRLSGTVYRSMGEISLEMIAPPVVLCKLKVIDFRRDKSFICFQYTPETREMMKNFMQTLINSAPNLEQLTLENLWDIVLPPDTKLLKLIYITELGFIQEKLTSLLTSCSHSLQTFELFCFGNHFYYSEDFFDIPIMPKLASIKLINEDELGRSSTVDQVWEKINPGVCPNLRTLHVSTNNPYNHQDAKFFYQLTNYSQWGKIISLKLPAIEDLELLRSIKKKHFPGLRNLQVQLLGKERLERDVLVKRFKRIIEVMKGMEGMKCVEICLPFSYSFEDLGPWLKDGYRKILEEFPEIVKYNYCKGYIEYEKIPILTKSPVKIFLGIEEVKGLKIFLPKYLLNILHQESPWRCVGTDIMIQFKGQ